MRKNTLLIITAFLLVGGSFVFAEYRNKQAKNIYNSEKIERGLAISAIDEIDSSAKDIDTDGDGSKDWEEILVGSNPRDPQSKPSTIKANVTGDITKSAPEKLEPIDVVSRDFFARYMELRQIGAVKDKFSQDELVNRVAGNIVLSEPAKYKINEIIVIQDTSNGAVSKYAQEVSSVFKKYSIDSRNEALIAKESVDEEDVEKLKEIDPIIKSYKNIINSLIKISTPQSITTLHLDLLNSMNSALFVAQSFRDSDKDSVKGVQGVAYYPIASKSLYDSMNAIKSYLNYSGIYENIF